MRVLVVGLGSMGRRRLRNLTHLGGVELAGFEPADARREEVGQEFGIPTFGSFEQALGWEPAALVISTPPDHHTEYALEAVRRGIHFFTEASVVPGDLDELVEAVEGASTVAAPSCTMRFHPAVTRMRELIGAGNIGKPVAVTHHVGQYLPDWHPWEDYRTYYVARRETGAAREIVPFELNWLTYLFGPATTFTALKDKVSSLEVDIDDIYSAVLRFERGVQASMVIEVVSRPAIRQARIIGEEGTLIWDWNARLVREWSAATGDWVEHPDPPPVEGPGGEWVAENMYIEEMRGYLDAIEHGQERWPFSVREDRDLLDLLAQLEADSDRLFARQ